MVGFVALHGSSSCSHLANYGLPSCVLSVPMALLSSLTVQQITGTTSSSAPSSAPFSAFSPTANITPTSHRLYRIVPTPHVSNARTQKSSQRTTPTPIMTVVISLGRDPPIPRPLAQDTARTLTTRTRRTSWKGLYPAQSLAR